MKLVGRQVAVLAEAFFQQRPPTTGYSGDVLTSAGTPAGGTASARSSPCTFFLGKRTDSDGRPAATSIRGFDSGFWPPRMKPLNSCLRAQRPMVERISDLGSAPTSLRTGHAPALAGAACWAVHWRCHNGAQHIDTAAQPRSGRALLARLALCAGSAPHAREELVELLWPGVELAVGRNRLRQALVDAEVAAGSHRASSTGAAGRTAWVCVLVAPGRARACDVADLRSPLARRPLRCCGRCSYGGELLPGFYDDWVDDERSAPRGAGRARR